jgi:solute carrier family 35 protein E1
MDAANLYAVMTILSAAMCLPITLIMEGKQIIPTINSLIAAGQGAAFAKQSLLAGIFYYLYNEVAFLTLDCVAPVTHALGNTIKRVVIIIASVVVFGTTMTSQVIFFHIRVLLFNAPSQGILSSWIDLNYDLN